MPTFVYMTRCDGCGHCVDICPSDIMHIDKTYRRAYNIEPNMCWECYSCVKACPQHAIDVRGYADFAPLGHSVREMLERLGEAKESGEAVSKYELALREPVEPVFRIGQLGLGYDQANELIVLVAYELPETENPDEVNAVRFWATPRQMRALAKHAEEIVSSGRPICVLCGRPIDPEGHFCPRRNGHGAKATLTE